MSARLSGWKEIAAHFQTTVRTVQRWERRDGLPVERVRRAGRDAVYAEIAALRRWEQSRSAMPVNVPALAVLPFRSHREPWVGEELAAALLQELARLSGVRMIGRTSSFSVAELPVPDVCRKLGAQIVMEGELTETGAINVRLVGSDGLTIWSRTFPRGPDDAWRHRQEIVVSVAAKLSLEVPASDPAVEFSAASLLTWLRARSLFFTLRPAECRAAIELLDRVVAAEPRLYPVLADLGGMYAQLSLMGELPAQESIARSNDLLDRALELYGNHADACLWKARNLILWHHDWCGAENLFRRALRAAPNHALLPCFYGTDLLRVQGRHVEALHHLDAAMLRDPVNPLIGFGRVQVLAALGRDRDAMDAVERVLLIDPNAWSAKWLKGALLLKAGAADEAWECLRQAFSFAPPYSWVRATYANACVTTGREAEALQLRADAERQREHSLVPPTTLAFLAAVCGDSAAALDWMEVALRERDPILVFQPHAGNGMVVLPEVERLYRDSPRWDSIVRTLGL